MDIATALRAFVRTVERASLAPADIALRFVPNSARNRKTSLIRRISTFALGTTPPAKKGGL